MNSFTLYLLQMAKLYVTGTVGIFKKGVSHHTTLTYPHIFDKFTDRSRSKKLYGNILDNLCKCPTKSNEQICQEMKHAEFITFQLRYHCVFHNFRNCDLSRPWTFCAKRFALIYVYGWILIVPRANNPFICSLRAIDQ